MDPGLRRFRGWSRMTAPGIAVADARDRDLDAFIDAALTDLGGE